MSRLRKQVRYQPTRGCGKLCNQKFQNGVALLRLLLLSLSLSLAAAVDVINSVDGVDVVNDVAGDVVDVVVDDDGDIVAAAACYCSSVFGTAVTIRMLEA